MFIEDPAFFSDEIAYHSRGGPKSNVDISEVESGRESRNSVWGGGNQLRRYDAMLGAKTDEDLDELNQCFEVADGPTNGFRFKDWKNYTATGSEGALLPTGVTDEWQMYKVTVRSGVTVRRIIQKPRPGTTIDRRGTWTIVIDGGGTYVVDYSSGKVTRTAGANPTGWSGPFDVPVRFDTDTFDASYDDLDASTVQLPMVEIRDPEAAAPVSEDESLFIDTFPSTGTLATHAPAVGGAYTLSPYGAGGALTDLILDGSGNLIIPATTDPDPPIFPTAKSVIGSPGTSWTLELKALFTDSARGVVDGAAASVPTVALILEDTAGQAGIFLWVTGNTANEGDARSTDPGQTYFQVYGSGNTLLYDSGVINFDQSIELDFKVIVTPSGSVFKLNGTTIGSTDQIPDVSPDAIHIGATAQSTVPVGLIREVSVVQPA